MTQEGRVKKEKGPLTLLLSTNDEDDLSEFVDLAELKENATTTSLRTALSRYTRSDVEKPKRLWIFYAGHAIAPFGATADQGPLLLPPDETNLEAYQQAPTVPFENFRQALREKGPDEQVIFIDACRAPMPSETGLYATTALLFERRDESEVPRKQALLLRHYQRDAGQADRPRVLQRGLDQGTQGAGRAGSVLLKPGVYALSFQKLVRYVIRQVQQMAENWAYPGAGAPPHSRPGARQVCGQAEGLPHPHCAASQRPGGCDGPGAASGGAHQDKRPPAQPPLSWRVTLGHVGYEVAAEGYETVLKETEIYEDVQLPVKLVEGVEAGWRAL